MPRRIRSTDVKKSRTKPAKPEVVIKGNTYRVPQFWSLSRFSKWRDCPLWYKFDCVMRMPQWESKAMERGISIHAKCEQWLKGGIRGLPDEMKKFAREFANLKRMKPQAEADWTIKADLTKTHGQDWEGAWLRSKIDAHVYFKDEDELLIVDFKTGKLKQSRAQMDLYAWVGSIYYPKVKAIDVELWFLDHDGDEATDKAHYERREIKSMEKKWLGRAEKMLADREWPATPGSHCQRCPRRSDKRMKDGRMGPCGAWRNAA